MANQRSVLVIDDEESIREVMRQALELDSYHVITAQNGLEALRVLSEERSPPCVMLVDLMMPIMDGWQFIQEVRKRPSLASVPIVVVSAYREKARLLGIESVIEKPFEISALLDVVNRYCT